MIHYRIYRYDRNEDNVQYYKIPKVCLERWVILPANWTDYLPYVSVVPTEPLNYKCGFCANSNLFMYKDVAVSIAKMLEKTYPASGFVAAKFSTRIIVKPKRKKKRDSKTGNRIEHVERRLDTSL